MVFCSRLQFAMPKESVKMLLCIIVIFTALFASGLTAPQNYNPQAHKNPSEAKIVRHENNIGIGNYNFSYETSDGSQRTENAELKNPGTEKEALSVQGSYTYIGTDGKTYKVTYIADENGYRATGEHLPKNEN